MITPANKKSLRVKSTFKSRDYVSNSYTMSKFTTLSEVKGVVFPCFNYYSEYFASFLLFAV